MTKLTSKVIQISPFGYENEDIRVLCEDGSIWMQFRRANDWHCILEANND
ncbi:MAG: hypothetical protein ACJAW3_001334 [Lentimonas sp.]|jgi:hypothetical protein